MIRWLFLPAVLLAFALPARGQSLAELRAQEAQSLDGLRDEFRARLTGLSPDDNVFSKLMNEYSLRKKEIQEQFLDQDDRISQIADIEKRTSHQISNSGSLPRTVDADVDLFATNDSAADTLGAEWVRKFGESNVTFMSYKILNLATDTTLWYPLTPERANAMLFDADAFTTEGGKEGTGITTAVRSELGWALANQAKFLHSQADDPAHPDIHIVAKSLVKIYERNSAFVDDGLIGADLPPGTESLTRHPKAQEVYEQAKIIRRYGDVFEAGIALLTDSQAQREAKEAAWLALTRAVFAREEGVALRHGAQQEVQDLYEANFWLGKRGEFFRQRLKRSRDSNRATLDALQPLWDTYSKLGTMSELDRVALNELTAYVRGPGPAAIRSSVRKEQLIIPPAGNSDRTAIVVKYLSDLRDGTARRQGNLDDSLVQTRWSAWMPKFRKTVCGAELAKAFCSSPADVNDLPAFIIRSERAAQSRLTR